MNKEILELIHRAELIHNQHHPPIGWWGRCIFLSWYCTIADCDFCYRSTQKSRIQHASHARRSIPSVLIEAMVAKQMGWRIEFLTGGFGIFPFDELVNIADLVSRVYGEKIWLNLGPLSKAQINAFRPYIKGICASLETLEPILHEKVCPSKPIAPYEKMLSQAEGLKKSIAIIIGLGEKREDFSYLGQFIEKHQLDRITIYRLHPIPGTPYAKGPSTEEFLWWIANIRISFPDIQIIAGTHADFLDEIDLVLRAGALGITKYPISKKFCSPEAHLIEKKFIGAGRQMRGTLTTLPLVDWLQEISRLDIPDDLKQGMIDLWPQYEKRLLRYHPAINQIEIKK